MSEPSLNELRTKLGRSLSMEDGLELLKTIEGLVGEGGLSFAQEVDFKLSVLRRLRESTAECPEYAVAPLLGVLLPLTLTERDDAGEADIGLYECRVLAGEWVNALLMAGWRQHAEAAVAFLEEQLRPPVSKAACWTLAEIGLRTDSVVEKLENVLRADDDELGDEALSTLAALGVTGDKLPFYREELARRTQQRLNDSLLFALQELGDARVVRQLVKNVDRFIAPSGTGLFNRKLIWVLGAVASRLQDERFQDFVVSTFRRLARRHAQEVGNTFHLGGELLPGIDRASAVEFLLDLLARDKGSDDRTANRHWLLFLRLQACVRPRQLGAVDVPPAASQIIHDHLLRPTADEEVVRPFSANVKSGALAAAFRLGLPGLDGWLEAACAAAADDAERQQIMESFQALTLPRLPDSLKFLVTERVDLNTRQQGEQEDVGWFVRTAATELVANSTTWEAFETLSNPGFLVDGDVLQTTTTALGDVSHAITADPANRDRVCRHLFDALTESPPYKSRVFATCHALGEITAAGRMPAAFHGELQKRAADTALHPYARGLLLRAVGFLKIKEVSGETLRLLSESAGGDEEWVSERALGALARLGVLATRRDLLESRLGLVSVHDQWKWDGKRERSRNSTQVIGMLFRREPVRFGSAMLDMVAQSDWNEWTDVEAALDIVTSRDKAVLDATIAEALVARVKKENTPHTTSKSLFASVAKWVPGRFQQEPWDKHWVNWLPDSKVGLADTLGSARSGADALRLLTRLKRDDDETVRRAANRALGRVEPQLLLDWCVSQGHDDKADLRQRTAEALWWVPSAHRSTTWHLLATSLVSDCHRLVRQAARAAEKEDQRRGWADEDCQRVIKLVEGDAASMLDVWRYGEALAEVGDDETLRRLVEHLQEAELPHNVRRWKVQVAKRLDKSWNTRSRKRFGERNPVQPGVEYGVGSCQTGPGMTGQAVSYALWRADVGAGSENQGWGGTLRLLGEDHDQSFQQGEGVRLTFEDGRVAEVGALSTPRSLCVGFTGLEAYPEIRTEVA